MTTPVESLPGPHPEFGLVGAVVFGICFGFVLERAGFGRATRLAAQFYLRDMTVFKVMFSAIVTAMVGLAIADGLGLASFQAVADAVASNTYLWPMLVGGLLLGVGFIISGYCPGTSLVSTASGHLDGLTALAGIAAGSVLFGELQPLLADFYVSGDLGQLYLHQLLGVPPAMIAALFAVLAVAAFTGAEAVERWARGGAAGPHPHPVDSGPRRLVFASLVSAASAGVALLVLPAGAQSPAPPATTPAPMTVDTLAHRILEEPWRVLIVDTRSRERFEAQRIPGSEHCPPEGMDACGLPYRSGVRDLVLVSDNGDASSLELARAYRGRAFILDGGFPAWQGFALTEPPPPPADPSPAQLAAARFRAAVYQLNSGIELAPPPPTKQASFTPPPKRKGQGCDS